MLSLSLTAFTFFLRFWSFVRVGLYSGFILTVYPERDERYSGLDFGRITVLGVQTFSISSIALSEADVVEMVFQFPP